MESKAPQAHERQAEIRQGISFPYALPYACVRAVDPKQDGRKVGERVDKLGNVRRVRVVGLAPVDGAGVVAKIYDRQRSSSK